MAKIVLVKPALAFVAPNDSCLETILHMIVAQLSASTFLCSYSCISIKISIKISIIKFQLKKNSGIM